MSVVWLRLAFATWGVAIAAATGSNVSVPVRLLLQFSGTLIALAAFGWSAERATTTETGSRPVTQDSPAACHAESSSPAEQTERYWEALEAVRAAIWTTDECVLRWRLREITDDALGPRA